MEVKTPRVIHFATRVLGARYKEKLAEYNKASRVGNIEEMADIQKSLSEKEQTFCFPFFNLCSGSFAFVNWEIV
jgi:hypothetical protein